MERSRYLFLQFYKCAISERKAGRDLRINSDDLGALLKQAGIQHVYPMICEALFGSEAAEETSNSFLDRAGVKAVKLTLRQAHMTAEFLKLYQYLAERNLHPIVMKGIICRSLYPHPEQRPSTDEDLLIPGELFDEYHKAFLEYGLTADSPAEKITKAPEVSYHNDMIYIELHTHAFPPDSKAYGELDRYFSDAEEHKIQQNIYGVPVYTLGYTDHLLYLLFHVYKHFLNCGIGIRQVSDILLYSVRYDDKIDWKYIVNCCRNTGMFEFCSAVYRIGDKYLLPDSLSLDLKRSWLSIQVDEEPLLNDMLSGGVYGTSSNDRLHSSNITLNAMEMSKKGNKPGVFNNTLLKTIFPSFRYMKSKYTYVSRFPFLIPVGWLHRITSYGIESIFHKSEGNNAADSMRIGRERVALLKKYRIIREGPATADKTEKVENKESKENFYD